VQQFEVLSSKTFDSEAFMTNPNYPKRDSEREKQGGQSGQPGQPGKQGGQTPSKPDQGGSESERGGRQGGGMGR
jgi:hypothetical protein